MTESYKKSFANTTVSLAAIRAFVRDKSSSIGFEAEDLDKIELAVDEACANVIEHAYPPGTVIEDGIHLCLQLEYGKLTIVITDRGDAFDPATLKSPDMNEYLAEFRIGGLGVYLMKTLMDQVDYDIQPGVCNEVKLVKYLVKEEKNA
ncbi:MAG TPA: ATP-binding protein [Chroococcales cyanobacterium]